MMNLVSKLRMYRRVFARATSTPGFVPLLKRRPPLMLAVGAYETALLVSGSVDIRIKTLAQLKTSSLVGCPF